MYPYRRRRETSKVSLTSEDICRQMIDFFCYIEIIDLDLRKGTHDLLLTHITDSDFRTRFWKPVICSPIACITTVAKKRADIHFIVNWETQSALYLKCRSVCASGFYTLSPSSADCRPQGLIGELATISRCTYPRTHLRVFGKQRPDLFGLYRHARSILGATQQRTYHRGGSYPEIAHL